MTKQFEQAYDNFLAGCDVDTTMLDCAEFMFNAGRGSVGQGEPVAYRLIHACPDHIKKYGVPYISEWKSARRGDDVFAEYVYALEAAKHDSTLTLEFAYTHPAQPVPPAGAQELRYTADRALAECPCCGSLDVGGVHDTVNCYGCGLTVTAPRPLQNAINKWNQRTNKAPAAETVPLLRLNDDALVNIYLECKAEWKATNKRQRQRIALIFGNAIMDAMERANK